MIITRGVVICFPFAFKNYKKLRAFSTESRYLLTISISLRHSFTLWVIRKNSGNGLLEQRFIVIRLTQ
jgi:hypothetical protein